MQYSDDAAFIAQRLEARLRGTRIKEMHVESVFSNFFFRVL
jgi:hypothetical protein